MAGKEKCRTVHGLAETNVLLSALYVPLCVLQMAACGAVRLAVCLIDESMPVSREPIPGVATGGFLESYKPRTRLLVFPAAVCLLAFQFTVISRRHSRFPSSLVAALDTTGTVLLKNNCQTVSGVRGVGRQPSLILHPTPTPV